MHPNFPSREWYYRAGGYEHWRWVPGGLRGGTQWTTKCKQRCGGRGVLQGVGQSGTLTGSRGLTRSDGEGPELPTSVTNDEWEARRWEQIIPRPVAAQLPPLSTTDRRRRTRLQDKLRDQQRANRWRNKHSTTATIQTNLKLFRWGSEAHRSTLVLTILQIRAAALSSGLDTHPNKAGSVWFAAAAETIYEERTQEEAMVQDLLEQWRKGGHSYIPDVRKGDDIVRLGCKNANSLSLFDLCLTKLRKLLSLDNKYQTDGACIVEHGMNFLMAPDGQRPEDIFAAFRGSRVSAAHNIHEQHSCYQQGGTLTAAFTRLSGYVTATGMDPTGLGCWSWVQVGSGEHRTRIVTAYQPCQGSTMQKLGRDGRLLHRGTVATQHT